MKVPLIWLKDYVETNKSAKELAASFTQLGLMLDKPVGSDNVLDLEHRMDRSDWLSIVGCARDLSAFEGLKLNLPKGYGKTGKTLSANDQLKITVQTPAVRRFQTRVFKDIKVGPSPKWLTDRLTAYGMEPKNNIVDITNFVMIEYGQPLHAQDLGKLKAREITLRPAKPGESVITLLGTEVKLDPDTFVLSSGGEVTVVGGVVGGKNTGVTKETTEIVLDAGNYDSRVVRKTSRRLKIINETVSRYDKFLDPRLIDVAISRATELILELAGGTYYDNDDYYPNPVAPRTQILRLSRLKLLSGMDLTLAIAKKILRSLDYVIVEEESGSLSVEVPYFRTDVEVEDDLISDILRIYNYTNIPSQPFSTPVPTDITPRLYNFEDRLRDLLVAQGAHEHVTSSLTTSNGQSDEVVLANALSADQNALRTNLLSGLKQVAATYQKHKLGKTTLFEIGKVFAKHQGKYEELRHLTVLTEKPQDSLATLLSSLGLNQYLVTKNLHVKIQGTTVGTISHTAYTLLTDRLVKLAKNYTGIISQFSHPITLDLSLQAESSLVYADIVQVLDGLNGDWEKIACKTMTKLGAIHNYLLTVTWPEGSQSVERDKEMILNSLKKELKITSKS